MKESSHAILGTADVPAGARVVVAMSGGVDSSVAAALLADRGFEVIGMSLRLSAESSGAGRSSGCCSLDDFRDAARVAEILGVPHYVLDMREAFHRAVIAPFVEEYLAGRTPSPCILCNREIKFGILHQKARELGADFVATGHYAIREHSEGRFRLLRAADPAKDQSYFLFETGQEQLAVTLFPIGRLTKEEVRTVAEAKGLPVARKPESQEICFVPDGRYADFVAKQAPDRIRPGAIRDEGGREIGRHDGVHRFTIGQRRGIGVAAAEPLYVSAVDAKTATVVTVPRGRLPRAGLEASGVRWTSGRAENDGALVEVRIRHRHRPVPARVHNLSEGRIRVWFELPEPAITPGQAAVIYRGEEVLGGGWIERAVDEGAHPKPGTREAACE